MKGYAAIILALFSFIISFAQNNQVIINNGKWNNNSSWGLGHSPTNGEIAIIPADSTLVVDNNNLLTTDITLKVYGTLQFQVGKLRLTPNSVVLLYPGGTITSAVGTPADKIEIGGVSKYTGNDGTLAGPLMANAGTSNFVFMPVTLPVKFIAYNIYEDDKGIRIKWTTAEEDNIARYEVERSLDGSSWRVIGQVESSERPSIVNYFSYIDKEPSGSVVYYRVKQLDKNGHFTYTSVKNIRLQSSSLIDLKISTTSRNIVIEFSQQLKETVVLRLISLSGQVAAQETYFQPDGYIIFKKESFRGTYILSIDNGHDIKISKQILLY
jgi:hypothetical protein